MTTKRSGRYCSAVLSYATIINDLVFFALLSLKVFRLYLDSCVLLLVRLASVPAWVFRLLARGKDILGVLIPANELLRALLSVGSLVG
jgi:hypothetical protein